MKSLRSEENPRVEGCMRNPWQGKSRYESGDLGSGDQPGQEENKVGKAPVPMFSSVTNI